MSGGGLASVELYNRRFDWLVAALAPIPLVWLFYGFEAAFICLLLFALIGALKPLITHLGSRVAAGLFAAGVILLISPVLRYIFYNGFCYNGAWSVAAGVSRYQVPDLCQRGLFDYVGQSLWVGPLRDVAMPVAGVGLIMLAWFDRTKFSLEFEDDEHAVPAAALDDGKSGLIKWSGLFIAVALWAGLTVLNYRAEQIALEERQRAEREEEAREAAIAAEEARRLAAERAAEERRLAAERAAKRVEQGWLVGNWVYVEGLSAAERRSIVYCETDNDWQVKEGGRYQWFDESGKFEIDGNNIRFFDRTRQEYAEPDAPIENLDDATSSIERDGTFIELDGETYARCRHS